MGTTLAGSTRVSANEATAARLLRDGTCGKVERAALLEPARSPRRAPLHNAAREFRDSHPCLWLSSALSSAKAYDGAMRLLGDKLTLFTVSSRDLGKARR